VVVTGRFGKPPFSQCDVVARVVEQMVRRMTVFGLVDEVLPPNGVFNFQLLCVA
jgi:hypothetical protein